MRIMVYTDGINKTTSHKEAVEMGIEKCITFEDIEAPIGSEERKFNEKADKANLENRKKRIEAGLPVKRM